ncbi:MULTISPECIES: Calx-beta domain-containing protein [unclassified Thalassolituus]|uniref:Calx-beta domain-containing protein n=1 Tax=unclassified Thalassolituus TaxID=2624967 RepID=UPI0025FD4B3C|nr:MULTISPECIES: Calx-beta domain-containing protein [unclassified Thalassolituus]
MPLVGEYTVEEGTEYAIIVEVLGDERIEGDEDFGVLITDENGQELTRLYGKIVNDDFPSYTVTATDVTEVDNGTSNLVYTITLSESTIDDFVLNAATVSQTGNGIATADEDYRPVNEEVVFTRGELTKTVTVTVFGDTDVEPDEAVTLSVTHASGMEQSATAYIRTDDVPGSGNVPTFEINAGRPIAVSENFSARDSEGYNQFDVTFTLHPDFAGSVTEAFDLTYQLIALDSYEYPDEAALADEDDFDPTSGVITILPETGGSSSPREYTATIRIRDDSELEGTEVLGFLLSNDEGAQFGFTYVLIRDNESPDFDVTVTGGVNDSLAIVEGDTNNPQTITVTYPEGQNGNAQDFRYSLFVEGSGNNKAALDDFISPAGDSVITSGTIRVGDGISSGENQISFTLNGDDVTEGNEEFYLQIFDESGNELQRQNGELIIYTFTIIDDDLPSVRWARVNDDGDESASDPLADVSGNINICEDGSFAGTDHCLATAISDDPSANGADVTESEPYHLYLVLGGSGASSALQNYAINITAVSTAASCNWTASGVLLEEDEYELQHSGTFAEGASRYRVRFTPENDDLVECDETVTLQATLSSADFSAVAGTEQSNDLDLTVKNNDISYVDIIGFSAYEELADAGSQAAQSGSTDTNAATVYRIRQTLAANTAVEYARIFGDTNESDYAPLDPADSSDALEVFASLAAAVDVSGLTELALSDTTEHLLGSLIVDDSVVEQNETAQLVVRFKASVYSSAPGDYPMALRVCASGDATSCSPATSIGSYSANADASGTILNDELVRVNLSSGPAVVNSEISAEESAGALSVYTISLTTVDSAGNNLHSGADFSGFSVTLAASLSSCADTTSACATSGTDYSITAGDLIDLTTLNIGSAAIELTFTDDSIVEPDETGTLTLALSAGSEDFIFNHSEVDGKSLNITIENDDFINPAITSTNSSGNEGSGSNDVDININLGAAIASNVDLDLTITDTCQVDESTGCGTPGGLDTDYSLSDSEFDLSGSTAEKTITLTILGDTITEPDEVVTLTLSLDGTNISNYVDPDFDSSTLKSFSYTIVNDDYLTPAISLSSSSALERNSGSFVAATLTLALTPGQQIADNVNDFSLVLSVACAAVGGGDCGDEESGDFISGLGSSPLTVDLRGESSPVSIDYSLQVLGDSLVEPDEVVTYTLALSADSNGAYLNPAVTAGAELGTASFIIENDDVLDISVSSSGGTSSGNTVTIGEGGSIIYSLNWDGEKTASNLPAVTFKLSDVTSCTVRTAASSDTNLGTAKLGTIELGTAVTQASFSPVTATDDSLIELNETTCITFKASVDGSFMDSVSSFIALPDDQTIVITDNDVFTVTVSGYVAEGGDFTINLSGNYQFHSDTQLTVTMDIEDIDCSGYSTANVSADYSDMECFIRPSEIGDPEQLISDYVESGLTFGIAESSGSTLSFTVTAAQDNLQTLNQWLLVNLSVADGDVFGDGYVPSPLLFLDNENQNITGTGISQCIQDDGSLDSCSDSSAPSADKEYARAGYMENRYTYFTAAGAPILNTLVAGNLTAPEVYGCVQDNYTGLIWNTSGTCGAMSVNAFTPSLIEVLSLMEYQKLGQNAFFNDTSYLTSTQCSDTDPVLMTEGYYLVNTATGAVTCTISPTDGSDIEVENLP